MAAIAVRSPDERLVPRHRVRRPWCLPRRRRGAARLRATSFACALSAFGLPLLFAVPVVSAAQDRLVRVFGQEGGLQPPIWALAQDSVGFLWIGAHGGLYRFDGVEFRRWAPDTIREAVVDIAVAPSGGVIVLGQHGHAFEITSASTRPVVLPGAARLTDFGRIAIDGQARLWVLQDSTLSFRTADGAWHTVANPVPSGERPRRVKANPVGGVDVMTPRGLWRVEPNEPPRLLLSASWVTDVWYHSPDHFVALTNSYEPAERLIEIQPGVRRQLLTRERSPGGRAISLVERQGTLWVALDTRMLAVRPGEPPEVLGVAEGINSGGPLMVDREGSLWLGTFAALVQFPEPETRTWTDRHDLISRHTRTLARHGEAIWVATWSGTSILEKTLAGWRAGQGPSHSKVRSCSDGTGTIWASTGLGSGVLEIRETSVIGRHSHPRAFFTCAPANNGGVWITAVDSLYYADPVERRVRGFAAPPGPGSRDALLHDRLDRLWLSVGESICSAPASRVFAETQPAWSCDSLPGAAIGSLIELPGGTLWAGSLTTGLHVRRNGRWLPASMQSLPARSVFSLAPSARGGVWMVGHGVLQRVEESDSGWTVLERLTRWQGIPTIGGGDVLEEEDGTIWIASEHGVTRVPASARADPAATPPIALVEARVDDQRVPLDSALRLPHDRNRIELRLAALSFRDPSQIRRQVRLGPREPWSESTSGASFRWVDLRPGRYEVEYRASLDGRIWSEQPLRFAFSVRPPWYRTSWALALALGMATMVAWAVYRARVAYLLGLERQRTRIAMDLHDEVGSGLASVGILSSVLATEAVSTAERRQAASDIASAAEELGNALSDIVWSLDPHAATLEELASRLAEHGDRLTARGDIEFTTKFPEAWPQDRLDVALRRNVLFVGLESLHNAVRHGSATRIVLGLSPNGNEWELVVQDNGVGFADAGEAGTGHGLRGMRRRAADIGAWLELTSAKGKGTIVSVRFALRPARLGKRREMTERLRRVLSAPLT